tara:strand:- start:286 stop:675 length:390 start_codon:yes stop_codon:yes gene_type:complete
MPKKIKRSTIVKKLDIIFSKFIRLSNADANGMCECVTCGNLYHWKKIQAGHFMSRRFYATRWDIENVAPQCYGCNVMSQGQQYKYSLYLGKSLSEKLYLKSKKTQKFSDNDLKDLINYYTDQVKNYNYL